MRTERRSIAIARGAAALVVLVLVLGALPLVLAREVGWPLPTAVPTLDQISNSITTGAIEDATIIKALAILVWLAWANFTTAVVLEGAAMVRGRQARRRPVTQTSQQLAAQLLTSVSLAFTLLGRPAVAVAGPDPAELRLVVVTALADPSAPSPDYDPGLLAFDRPTRGVEPRAPRSAHPVVEGSGSAYVVQRGDTLWDLAERFLGDGFRWREIRDANIGRPQPDGGSLRSNSEDIRGGWTLLIPSRDSVESSNRTADAPADQVGVEPGDTLWDIADEHLGDPHRWPEVYEQNEGRPQPDGRALNDPDLIQPGWVLDMPDDDSAEHEVTDPAAARPPAVESESSPDSTAIPPTSEEEQPTSPLQSTPAETVSEQPAGVQGGAAGGRGTAEPSAMDRDHADGEAQGNPLVVASAAAVLAAGVMLTLDRLRRTRLRRRQPGTRIPLPVDDAAVAEQRLRALADDDAAEFVDLALRELAECCAPSRVPPVSLVSYNATGLQVQLAGSHEPPEGWQQEEDGAIWVRPRPADVDDLSHVRGTPSPLPALVTIGAIDGVRPTLVNLAQAGCLHVEGEPRLVIDHLRAWALELATTQRADAIDVIVYGVPGLPSGLERLEVLPDDENPTERLSAPSIADGAGPATVFLAANLDKDVLSWIRIATEQRTDLVAVVAAAPPRPGAWTLEVGDDSARLDALDTTYVPLLQLGGTFERAGELLDQAKFEEDKPVPIPAAPEDRVITLDAEAEPTPKVTVRVLGNVDVLGAGPFVTNKTTELVVYLAMHRDGADADTLHEALWPDQHPRLARVHTEASRARKALGTGTDGALLLPPAEMGMYRLSDEVVLDYDQFRAHVAAARDDVEGAEDHLRAALELVKGRPLTTGPVEYCWAINDSYRITQEVVDAAHALAQLLIADGRYDEVGEIAEAGLSVDPVAEVLIRDLMEAAGATGNTARVDALMARLRRQVLEGGDANDADDYLHPQTLVTFERLRRRENPTGTNA